MDPSRAGYARQSGDKPLMNHPYRPQGQIEFPKTNDEKNLDLLGLLHYVAAGITALFSCMFIVHIAMGLLMTADAQRVLPALGVRGLANQQQPLTGTILVVVGSLAMVAGWTMAALLAHAGRCIRLRRGHLFCFVVAALSCLSVPLGTLLGVFTLVLLTKPHIRLLFERGADAARDTPPPMVRPWLAALAGLVALGAIGVFVVSWSADRVKLKRAGTPTGTAPSSPSDTPEARSRAAFRVAPGPLPITSPLLGPEGADADGYPTRYVDRAALRSLLHAHRFKDLDRYIEELQAAFEADPRKEYWPIDAGEAFGSAEPDFRTVQQLDYALSRQNRFPEIAVLWDAYLAIHSDDGRAFMERSGTNHRLGKVVQARADAARACELGISEGCERAAAP